MVANQKDDHPKQRRSRRRSEISFLLLAILASISILSETKSIRLLSQGKQPHDGFELSSFTQDGDVAPSPLSLWTVPIEPRINPNCRVEFITTASATTNQQQPTNRRRLCSFSSEMSSGHGSSNNFQQFRHEASVDVVVRLLEYYFECSARHFKDHAIITSDDSDSDCFWMIPPPASHVNRLMFRRQPSAARTSTAKVRAFGDADSPLFLLPFLYHDYYALITARFGYEPAKCIVDFPLAKDLQKNYKLKILDLPSSTWKVALSQLRLCDYVASGSREGLVLADAMGIPALSLNNENHETFSHTTNITQDIVRSEAYHRKRALLDVPALEKHNTSQAQETVDAFPFQLFTTSSLNSNTVPQATTTTNKTLVIVLGSLRGGEETWQSMYRNLLDINNADLALMIGQQNGSSIKHSSMNHRAKYTWEFPEYENWADAVDQINGSSWRTTLLPKVMRKSSIMGGVQGHHGSGAIIFMARYWLLQELRKSNLLDGTTYERFVLTRADYFHKCPQSLDELDPRYLWVPYGEDYGGVTDRFWIMNHHHIPKALGIFENLILNHERMFKRVLGSNPEQLIRYSWTVESLFPHQIRRFPRTMYTVFVHGVDQSRWKNHNRKWGITEDSTNNAEALYIKYVGEYRFAKCYCNGGSIHDDDNNFEIGTFTDALQNWTCRNKNDREHHKSQ